MQKIVQFILLFIVIFAFWRIGFAQERCILENLSPNTTIDTDDIKKGFKEYNASESRTIRAYPSPASLTNYREILDIPITKVITMDELVALVLQNIDKIMNRIPTLPGQAMQEVNYIEQLAPGLYALPRRPTVSFLHQLPLFKNGNSECGIFLIANKWLITVGEDGKLATELPRILAVLNAQRRFSIDMHTHPGDDEAASSIDRKDIAFMDNTLDGYIFIITKTGIIEAHRPLSLPGGYSSLDDVQQSWRYWVVEELGLTEDAVERIVGWELEGMFHERFFGRRLISWENEGEIEQILIQRENLARTNLLNQHRLTSPSAFGRDDIADIIEEAI